MLLMLILYTFATIHDINHVQECYKAPRHNKNVPHKMIIKARYHVPGFGGSRWCTCQSSS